MFYRASDKVALRSTISTGFRAPTPGQANISNISTVADAGGDLYQKELYLQLTQYLFITAVKNLLLKTQITLVLV